jgi:hypothetical protein
MLLETSYAGLADRGDGARGLLGFPGLKSETWGTRVFRNDAGRWLYADSQTGGDETRGICGFPGLKSETWGTRRPSFGGFKVLLGFEVVCDQAIEQGSELLACAGQDKCLGRGVPVEFETR